MEIILVLDDEDGNRKLEDVEENIKPFYELIIEAIEEIFDEYEIKFKSLEVKN